MSVIAKLKKRRKYPVTIDGETVYVRALLCSEVDELKPIANDDESVGFMIGCGLLNDDGTAAFTRQANEDSKAFGQRVLDELDIPTDTRSELMQKLMQLAKGPVDVEKLAKN